MKMLLVSFIAILIVVSFSNGQSQSAVRLPSSYRNGVKWALATNYQPLTLLETVGTQEAEEEGVVYILPAAEHGIQNYALHTYANDNSHSVQQNGIAFSTTELPPQTFVSSQINVPENKLSTRIHLQPQLSSSSFATHLLPTGIKSTNYQTIPEQQQQPLNTYKIAQDYLTNLLSRSSVAITPKPDIVSHPYAPQIDAKSEIISTYTATPQVNLGVGDVSTYSTTAKPFGSSIVSETYTPESHHHHHFSGKFAPILSTSSPSVYSPHLVKTANTFGNGLSLKSYQSLDELKPIVSSTTYKPEIIAENGIISNKNEETLSEYNGYKFADIAAKYNS